MSRHLFTPSLPLYLSLPPTNLPWCCSGIKVRHDNAPADPPATKATTTSAPAATSTSTSTAAITATTAATDLPTTSTTAENADDEASVEPDTFVAKRARLAADEDTL